MARMHCTLGVNVSKLEFRVLSVVFDNFRQRNPEGSHTGSFNLAGPQFAALVASRRIRRADQAPHSAKNCPW
jgi:hypothetical protein